jgi:hypothetical protein
VHLPVYFEFELDKFGRQKLLRALLLLAHFPTARTHPWFQQALSHLENYRTPDGTYAFPRDYLTEAPSGYWIQWQFHGPGRKPGARPAAIQTRIHLLGWRNFSR